MTTVSAAMRNVVNKLTPFIETGKEWPSRAFLLHELEKFADLVEAQESTLEEYKELVEKYRKAMTGA